MKLTLKKLWFVVAITVASTPGLAATVCQTAIVAANSAPQGHSYFGIAIALNHTNPIAPSFEQWVRRESRHSRFAERVLDSAVQFAYAIFDDIETVQTNKHTFIRFSDETKELAVIVNQRILYYDILNEPLPRGLTPSQYFQELVQRNLRGGEGLEEIAPFEPGNRTKHFENHGSEFRTSTEEKYEEKAIKFATVATFEGLVIDVTEHGKTRKMKIDFSSAEILVTSSSDNAAITYFKRSRNTFGYFFSKALSNNGFP